MMAPELISTVYFINPSRQCVCVCILPTVARKWLCKQFPASANTRSNRRTVRCIVFYAVCVISKESLWVFLHTPSSLPDKGWVNMFPLQRRHSFLCGPCRRRLVLPRTTFILLLRLWLYCPFTFVYRLVFWLVNWDDLGFSVLFQVSPFFDSKLLQRRCSEF
jgi:hypothetical protein